MAGSSRKNDPFHFDEIYKQAGVGDLFVKRTMAEQKQKPSPGPVPSVSPVRPAEATPAPRPAANPASFDLDFLASIATPGGTPLGMSKQNSSASLTGAGLVQPQPQAPPQPPVQTPPPAAPPQRIKPSDDPFALFEEVPGAAPPQRHDPAPVARPAAVAGGLLLDFDDGHAFPSAPAAPSQSSISLLSPSAGPRAPESPAQPAALQAAPAAAQSKFPSYSPPPPDYSDHAAHRPALPGSAAATTRPLAAATAGASAAPPASPSWGPTAFPDGHTAAGRRDRDPGSSQVSGSREFSSAVGSMTSASSVTAAVDDPPQLPQPPQQHPHQHSPPPQQHKQDYYDLADGPESSQPSNSSAPSFTWGHTPSGSGLSAYLKAFGKKAVRAAKAGLATLEHALEGLDSPQHHPGQHQNAPQQRYQGQGAGAQHAPPSGHAPGRGRSDVETEGVDVSNDEALAWAVRLADLSPHAQQQELGHMAPPLRRKVIEVLREQVRSEYEAAAVAAAVTGAVAPGGGSGGGLGHGASDLSRAQAPPPSPYEHGMPLLPRSSQDGTARGQEQLGLPRERSGGAVAATTPPGYYDAAQHPIAVARLAQPPQAPAPAADLLGLGSGELHARPVATAGSAAAAPTAAPSVPAPAVAAAPIVDDLLGIGDDAPPAREAAGASGVPTPAPASKPSGPAAAAPPPPPLPQQTAIHVDEMEDFFSGGKSAPVTGGSGGSGGLNMHGSSSAPNPAVIRPGGGATAVSSSTAALADMLHGSDDEVGGGGGNVDVSGYADLYRGEQGSADEPELRRRLRAQREAAKHAKMKAALAEKLAMEAEEAARREQQVVLKDQYKADIEVWKNKNKGNIRGLLGSLHTVLWPDSGWAPVSVGDLLEPIQVKKVYMRANLLVHPDKVRQRNGSADQVAIADMVFDVLKDAWNAFR